MYKIQNTISWDPPVQIHLWCTYQSWFTKSNLCHLNANNNHQQWSDATDCISLLVSSWAAYCAMCIPAWSASFSALFPLCLLFTWLISSAQKDLCCVLYLPNKSRFAVFSFPVEFMKSVLTVETAFVVARACVIYLKLIKKDSQEMKRSSKELGNAPKITVKVN